MKRVLISAAIATLAMAAVASVASDADDKALLAAQAARIEAEIARLAPQRPGVTDVYFVGFAGYGEQGVFRKEALYARDRLAERYGALERSVLLINDSGDRASFALATVTNLRQVLRLIGARMERDEDVLILFLTSHGDPRAGLDVRNGRLPLLALRPRILARALEEAGIRWRVVIASACYAGIFVKPLRNDTTLVMTAADARHNSFGCADERELTYFGEALLRDALPVSRSLEEAFIRARRIIGERESAENLEPSRPQLFVGAHLRGKLAALDASSAPEP